MDKVAPFPGFLVITIYLPRRRWYGRMKSKLTIESAAPIGEHAEIRNTLLEGWIQPQMMYYEHRIPATIHSHAP